MSKRIMFTGGSGKAGRHVVKYLVDQGHQVLNIDAKPLDNPKVRTACMSSTRRCGPSRSTRSSISPPSRAS